MEWSGARATNREGRHRIMDKPVIMECKQTQEIRSGSGGAQRRAAVLLLYSNGRYEERRPLLQSHTTHQTTKHLHEIAFKF